VRPDLGGAEGGDQIAVGEAHAPTPHAARQKYVIRDLVIPPRGYAVVAIGPPSCYQSLGLPRIEAGTATSRTTRG
jgi:hypothetical protein